MTEEMRRSSYKELNALPAVAEPGREAVVSQRSARVG